MSSSSHPIFPLLFLVLFFWSCRARPSSNSIGPLSVPRRLIRIGSDDRIEKQVEKADYAVVLNATNFDSVFRDSPANYAIVEFYAHWCPACRNYKPHYEKVARLFNGEDAVHPGIILMTRIDCALKINTNLCDKFSVGHYPILLWGAPSKLIDASWEPKKANNGDLRWIDDRRTADRLLNWINMQIDSSYTLDDAKYGNDHLQTNTSKPGQVLDKAHI